MNNYRKNNYIFSLPIKSLARFFVLKLLALICLFLTLMVIGIIVLSLIDNVRFVSLIMFTLTPIFTYLYYRAQRKNYDHIFLTEKATTEIKYITDFQFIDYRYLLQKNFKLSSSSNKINLSRSLKIISVDDFSYYFGRYQQIPLQLNERSARIIQQTLETEVLKW